MVVVSLVATTHIVAWLWWIHVGYTVATDCPSTLPHCHDSNAPLIHFCVWIAKRRTYFTLLFGCLKLELELGDGNGQVVCIWWRWCRVGSEELGQLAGNTAFTLYRLWQLTPLPLSFQVVPHIWYMFWCRAWVNCVTGIVNFRNVAEKETESESERERERDRRHNPATVLRLEFEWVHWNC